MKITIFYAFVLLFWQACSPVKELNNTFSSIENGVYHSGNFFVFVENSIAYQKKYLEGEKDIWNKGKISVWVNKISDSLIKKDDSTYSGKDYKLYLSNGNIYWGKHIDLKRAYPIKLKLADSTTLVKLRFFQANAKEQVR